MTTAELARTGRQFALSIDRVWLLIGAVFVLLLIFDPDQAPKSLRDLGGSLVHIAPYLLLAVGAAAYTSASGADSLIARAFHGKTAIMVAFAALFGALSPFCSCGVIPIIAALLAMGVPLAPVMAFWLSSPLMDPTMFLVTVGEIGLDFAIAKTLFAILMGLWGGYAIMALSGRPMLANPLREGVGDGGCCAKSVVRAPKQVHWTIWDDPERLGKFRTEAVKTFFFLLKWLSLAYLLESLFVAYVPTEAIAAQAGGGGVLSIVLAALLGLPLYINGYAAVALVGGLMDQGLGPGAAMAFVMSGGVSCIPAAVGVWALVKRPVFALYVALGLTGAVAAGLAFQLWTAL